MAYHSRVKLAFLGAIALLAACAHRSATECDRFTGSYVVDPASCHDSRGVLQTRGDTARFPDGSVLEPAIIGIHQDNCDAVSFVIRGRPGFEVETQWKDGALTHMLQRERSNLPPPIAIGVHGVWYFSLRRKPGSDDLLYIFGYAERGLVFLIPHSAHHETTCTFTRQR